MRYPLFKEFSGSVSAGVPIHRVKIAGIRHEFHQTWSYTLKPSAAGDLGALGALGGTKAVLPDFVPGQFAHLVAPQALQSLALTAESVPGDWVRCMSIASLPQDQELVFSMDLGLDNPYNAAFRTAQCGDELGFFQIGGKFTLARFFARLLGGSRGQDAAPAKIVFLAGGMGITPIRSLIRQIEVEQLPVCWELVYSAKNYLYRQEFLGYHGKQHYTERTGFAKLVEQIVATAPSAEIRAYFIAGSSDFIRDTSQILLGYNVYIEEIYTEYGDNLRKVFGKDFCRERPYPV